MAGIDKLKTSEAAEPPKPAAKPRVRKPKPAAVKLGSMQTYTLTDGDAITINKRRADSQRYIHAHRKQATGVIIHVGSRVEGGDQVPAIVTKVDKKLFNVRCVLDGNDDYWLQNVEKGKGPGKIK